MELVEVNRTVIISIYNYLHKNGIDPINIYVDQDTLTIFNPVKDKPITRLLKLDLSKRSARNVHFAQTSLSFIASFSGVEQRVSVPYASIIGYELHGRLCITPTASQMSREELNTLFEVMEAKASSSNTKTPKSNVVMLFPREFKQRTSEHESE